MADGGENLDAIALEDAGPAEGDALTMDAMAIAVQGYHCTEFSPEAFGLSTEVAAKVAMVIDGRTCAPIYVSPKIIAQCGGSLPDVIPLKSNARFEGTIFIMEGDGGLDLQAGQILYKAFSEPCLKFPEMQVKALGIQLKPIDELGISEAEVQARIETGDIGELLLRVHVWKGDVEVISMDGSQFLDLTTGMQVLLDPANFEVLQAFSVGKPDDGMDPIEEEPTPAAPVVEGLDAGSYASDSEPDVLPSDLKSETLASGGCSTARAPGGPKPMDLGPVFAFVGVLLIGRYVREQVGNVSFWRSMATFFDQSTKPPKE